MILSATQVQLEPCAVGDEHADWQRDMQKAQIGRGHMGSTPEAASGAVKLPRGLSGQLVVRS